MKFDNNGWFQGIFLTMFFLILIKVDAQTDLTYLLTNPGFETGNSTGWVWKGTDNYVWVGVNIDGDNTKTGSYVAGIWNPEIGDIELSQTITGLPDGYYRVTADLMGSSNSTTSRLTTQRLFANNNSMLFGKITESSYTKRNLSLIGDSSSYCFGNYTETESDRGPFKKLSVVVNVTDGSLTFGIRSNGKSSDSGFTFPNLEDGDGHGWFKVDNFTLTEVSKVATLDNIELNEGSLDKFFNPEDTLYNSILPYGTTSVTPYVVLSANGAFVTGTETIDVSEGNGKSVIHVVSIDGMVSKTYTVNYTVMEMPAETITSYNIDSSGINFILYKGNMRLQVCSDKIVRVSFCKSDSLPKRDTIMVNNKWGKTSFQVFEDSALILLSTSKLNVKVNKSNSLISFLDTNNKLILSENNKSVEPVNLTQYSFQTNTCSAIFNSPTKEAFYGLGQHQQRIMNYKGHKQTLDQQNGEIALPFVISDLGYGILWDNYSSSIFDGSISGNTRFSFSSESGKMVDYYFMYGPEIDEIISANRLATGKAPLFPKWAYGLFQSKDKYTTSEELLQIAKKYRDAEIPLDCIVQDWDYWTPDVWGSNTMDPVKYPNPKSTVDALHKMNLHTMISIWPVFHQSSQNYHEYESIDALYPSGGMHYFYDPHNSTARNMYWNQVNSQLFSKYGWDAWWADNNEPQGYPDAIDRKGFTTAKGKGVSYYNTYPIMHVSGVYESWRKDIPDKRVFILSRSALSGQQRYAAASWSGDIQSNWNDLQNQLSAGLNFCLSGIPYWTTDIGGYFGTDWSTQSNNELMIRWFQYGAFCPLFRIHGKGDKSMVSTHNLSNSTVQAMLKFDKLRYRLMPYIYSLAWKVTNEDYTIMRHLIMEYRQDINVKDIDDQFFFGPFMMVNPVVSLGQRSRDVYLPEGKWYDFWSGSQIDGGQTLHVNVPLDHMPIYIKAGSIIPIGPEIQYANQISDTLEIRIYKGASGKFTLYEDAGDTYGYEKGEYTEIPLSYNNDLEELTINTRSGSYPDISANRVFKIVWVDENHGNGLSLPSMFDKTINYDGKEMIVKYEKVSATLKKK